LEKLTRIKKVFWPKKPKFLPTLTENFFPKTGVKKTGGGKTG